VTTGPPTADQLRSILDYISPVSGVGGQGDKVTYAVSELVKGARDAEDALKKFKEDNENFVRPVVGFFLNWELVIGFESFLLTDRCRLLTGLTVGLLLVIMSLRFCAWSASFLTIRYEMGGPIE
jgi:hypothetical protein